MHADLQNSGSLFGLKVRRSFELQNLIGILQGFFFFPTIKPNGKMTSKRPGLPKS